MNTGILKRLIRERVCKAGYIIKIEDWICNGEITKMESAYTETGYYIGTVKTARYLVSELGIRPQPRTPESSVCSIGFSYKKQKWYGWSHRAIASFGKKSVCKPGDCHYKSTADGGKGRWVASSLQDAYIMACEFAESVS